jgi:hypothetical protein
VAHHVHESVADSYDVECCCHLISFQFAPATNRREYSHSPDLGNAEGE